MPLAAWLKALWVRWCGRHSSLAPSYQSRSRNEAAATLAFAFRELLKHSGEKGLAGVYSELGCAIAQALSTYALEASSTSAFMEKPLVRMKHGIDLYEINEAYLARVMRQA